MALSTIYDSAVSPAAKKAHHVATVRSISHNHYGHDHTLQRSEPLNLADIDHEVGSDRQSFARLAAACPISLDRTLRLFLCSLAPGSREYCRLGPTD